MIEHSSWSASKFEQAMLCPGSRVLQRGAPRTVSEAAAEGTAAHQVLTWALQEGKPAAAYIGRDLEADGFQFTVSREMVEALQRTIDYVAKVAGPHGAVLVDQRVNYSTYLELPEDQAWGTLDVAVLLPEELVVIDLKYGRGVEVFASDGKGPNPQLALYGLGALQQYKQAGGYVDDTPVRLVIHQPRLSEEPSEHRMTVAELEAWAYGPARSTVMTGQTALGMHGDVPDAEWNETFLAPGDKQCRFCQASATCPALRAESIKAVFDVVPASPDDFEPVSQHTLLSTPPEKMPADWLATVMAKADMIEAWLTAVRAETERRLLAGEKVAGQKLVQGRQGPRAWIDEAAAEAMLRKQFRLTIEQAYDLKLISPTTAGKLAKAALLGEKQWAKLQPLITRSPGKIHVAPDSDPRPAIDHRPVAEDFEAVAVGSEFA